MLQFSPDPRGQVVDYCCRNDGGVRKHAGDQQLILISSDGYYQKLIENNGTKVSVVDGYANVTQNIREVLQHSTVMPSSSTQ